MVKLIKSDAALHILSVGMLTTKKLLCLSSFPSQSVFVTCWEKGDSRVKKRKCSHVPFAIPTSFPLSVPLHQEDACGEGWLPNG